MAADEGALQAAHGERRKRRVHREPRRDARAWRAADSRQPACVGRDPPADAADQVRAPAHVSANGRCITTWLGGAASRRTHAPVGLGVRPVKHMRTRSRQPPKSLCVGVCGGPAPPGAGVWTARASTRPALSRSPTATSSSHAAARAAGPSTRKTLTDGVTFLLSSASPHSHPTPWYQHGVGRECAAKRYR